MSLRVDVKTRSLNLRNEGLEPLFEEVKAFCVAKKIKLPHFSERKPRWGRSRLYDDLITKEHHYCDDTLFPQRWIIASMRYHQSYLFASLVLIQKIHSLCLTWRRLLV
jgi:hypothetical protein